MEFSPEVSPGGFLDDASDDAPDDAPDDASDDAPDDAPDDASDGEMNHSSGGFPTDSRPLPVISHSDCFSASFCVSPAFPTHTGRDRH